jgi:hypothetical protein
MICVALTTTHLAKELQRADIVVRDLAELDEARFLQLLEI